MALHNPLFVSGAAGGVTQPKDARLALSGLLAGAAAGVLTGGAVTGSSSGPNMKYTIAAGTFATVRGTLAADGVYVTNNDGPFTADSGAPAPGSGTRWDLVWVRALNAFGSDGFGDANSVPVFGVTVGTSGASPTKPYASVPAGALVLAEASVGTSIANASLATITQVAPAAAARGGILPCSGSAQYPAGPRVGDYVDDTTLGLMRWNGTKWVQLNARAQYSQSATTGQTTMPNGSYAIIYPLAADIDTIGLTQVNGLFTFPAGSAGKYEISARVGFDYPGATTILCGATIAQNANVIANDVKTPAAASAHVAFNFTPLEITVNDSDTINVQGFIGAASQKTSITAGLTTFIRVKRISVA